MKPLRAVLRRFGDLMGDEDFEVPKNSRVLFVSGDRTAFEVTVDDTENGPCLLVRGVDVLFDIDAKVTYGCSVSVLPRCDNTVTVSMRARKMR